MGIYTVRQSNGEALETKNEGDDEKTYTSDPHTAREYKLARNRGDSDYMRSAEAPTTPSHHLLELRGSIARLRSELVQILISSYIYSELIARTIPGQLID